MSEEVIEPVDGVQLLRSYLLHCRYVRRGIGRVERALAERADCHDDSKLMADEFAGFSRINKAARQHPYGSDEYRAGLKQEKPTIDLHYTRNSHHPEFHGTDAKQPTETEHRTTIDTGRHLADTMTFLDLIEMVCDWRGAYLAYGSQGTWAENMERQKSRYNGWFTGPQWWLIEQVSDFLIERKAVPDV